MIQNLSVYIKIYKNFCKLKNINIHIHKNYYRLYTMSNFKDFLDKIDDHNEIVETVFNIDESKFSSEFQDDIIQLKRILNELPKKLQNYVNGDTAKDRNVLILKRIFDKMLEVLNTSSIKSKILEIK